MNPETSALEQPKRGWKSRALLLLFIASVAVIATAALWLANTSREPSWQGKRLTTWLLEVRNSESRFDDQNDPKIIQCRQAVRSIGTNAIPVLLRILNQKDSKLKEAATDLLDRQHLIKINIRSAEEQKDLSVIGFYLLGDLATNAVPALADIASQKS